MWALTGFAAILPNAARFEHGISEHQYGLKSDVQGSVVEKGPPRVSGGEVTNFRKNEFVGEYHQSKVTIRTSFHIDDIPVMVQ